MIFNRSHYEDVLVPVVNGWIDARSRRASATPTSTTSSACSTETGTVVLKFLLHISKDEQRERLQERLDDPTKHWKFGVGDLEARKHWDEYQDAYGDALARDRHAVGALDHRARRFEDPPQPDDRDRGAQTLLEPEAALPARRSGAGDAGIDERADRTTRATAETPMTDLSAEFKALANYRPTHKVRFVTAASLFDGHDAAINIMRRILQGMGAEVIHLGHNRSVDEVVTAALQEDAQGIAISSYQGGHVEYFKYMVDLLRERGGAHIQVFGGGGGVIVPRRDPRAAGLRRRAHLQPGGRPAHGPGRE